MRTHCNNNQLYAQVQPKRRILTKLESVLNLTRSGIISLTLVFCMLLTLLPATTVRAMAAEAGEETVTSWEDLVQKYGQTDGSDGITNITIPQGTVVRATVPLVVGSGEYSITGGSIYADFQLSADSTLTIDGPETKIYGTLTNEGTCNYNGGAIRKIVNTGEGALTISGVELGEEDLSDGSGSDDGFYTTIENNGKGEITINSCTIYNCHIDNIGEDSRLNFYECKASPRSGDSFLITNQGIAAVNSGEYHGIVIENKSLLTIFLNFHRNGKVIFCRNRSV